MKRVKITKTKATETPTHPTPLVADYIAGQINENLSLPCEYWITGTLIEGPVVGKSVQVFRDCRNGVKTTGVFLTSLVTEITPTGFKTLNSEYLLEALD